MTRNIDLHCDSCGHNLVDRFTAENETVRCGKCGAVMTHVWWSRPKKAFTEWPEGEAAVVFEKPDGTFSFPGRNDKPCPPGWTRHVARSDRQMAQLERMTGTRSEARWFDRGSGRGHDDSFRGKDY